MEIDDLIAVNFFKKAGLSSPTGILINILRDQIMKVMKNLIQIQSWNLQLCVIYVGLLSFHTTVWQDKSISQMAKMVV